MRAATNLGPVVCFGVHILDILGRPVSQIPPGQHSVIIDEIRVTAAGTAAGASVDLAKLGVRVQNIGAIGDDMLGDIVLTLLKDYGVGTELISRLSGQVTSATILPIRPNGERPALHAPGANGAFGISHVTPAQRSALLSAAGIHFGGLDAMTGLNPADLAELASAARARGAIVTMDVLRNGGVESLESLAPVLRNTDWFCPNDEQLLGLTGESDLHRAALRVLGLGARGVAVTCGANGCRVIDADSDVIVPSIEVSVMDTTGCGDGFDAGFLTGLLAGLSPVQAAWVGTVCGSLVATGLGSDAGITDLGQVASMLLDTANDDAKYAGERLRSKISNTESEVGGRE
ncbi:MAG: carbohydrate kinase family protein [Acidimicrobiaceae bacterium]|nr:carbohydrate kinase family protein [Acidimicrobiaceae bacterium]